VVLIKNHLVLIKNTVCNLPIYLPSSSCLSQETE